MKNIKTNSALTIIVLVSIIFTSCENYGLFGIKGSGPIVSKEVQANTIEGLNLDIPATVQITKSDEQQIRIDAQQNILDNIDTYIENGALTIKFDKNVGKHEDINIYISLEYLNKLSISGSGNIYSDSDFTTDDKLVISISGSGNIDVSADAPSVEMSISGSGNIKLITYTQSLNSNISGSGDILLGGKSGTANFSTSGSGDIKAYDFETEMCTVSTAGSGISRVYATNSLDVTIAGSGDVYYKGHPSLNVSVSGSGNVINAN